MKSACPKSSVSGKKMDQVMVESGFKGSFAEFLEYLRTDPKFYSTTPRVC